MIFRGPNNVIFYFFFFLNETLTSHRCPTIGASAQECSAFRPILPFLNTTRVNVLSNHLQSKLRLCYGFLYFKNIFTLYLHLYQKDMQMHNAFLFGFDFFIFIFNKQTNLLAQKSLTHALATRISKILKIRRCFPQHQYCTCHNICHVLGTLHMHPATSLDLPSCTLARCHPTSQKMLLFQQHLETVCSFHG